MKHIYCIKLGGSIITDKAKPYTAQVGTIRKIAKVLKKVKQPIIIAHGSGSFGHTSARTYGGKTGYTDRWGIAKVARDAQEINRIVMDIFIEEGIPAISFSPRSMILTERANVHEVFFQTLRESLDQGLIPVVYGDVIWDRSQKTTIFSGETILNAICQYLQRHDYAVSRIIQLCNVDGVLDTQQKIVPEITKENWLAVQKYFQEITVADVTGGMKHKVEDALALSTYGIETILINAKTSRLRAAINGKSTEGTIIR